MNKNIVTVVNMRERFRRPKRASVISTAAVVILFFGATAMFQRPKRASVISTHDPCGRARLVDVCFNALNGLLSFLLIWQH